MFLGQADVVAHIAIVIGLLYQQFQIGIHLPHEILHSLEEGGIYIALIATISAALGEVLAMTFVKKVSFS